MNKILIFLIISTAIVAFSVITLSSAPLINKTIGGIDWATDNCQFIADQEELTDNLDRKYSLHRQKTLCERRKAMYGLEYASFIFDVISGFLCLLLSFLRYLKIGKGTEKNTGLVYRSLLFPFRLPFPGERDRPRNLGILENPSR